MRWKARISGWILPDGTFIECLPWEHIKIAKSMPFVVDRAASQPDLQPLLCSCDDEALRECLAELGLVKVCYHLVDANSLTNSQLRTLQQLYSLIPPDEDIEFIGRIRLKIQARILLKIKDPERINRLF